MILKKTFLFLVLSFVVFDASSFAQPAGQGGIIIYGDSRTDRVTHRTIVKKILAQEPDLVFHLGDMVTDGRRPQEWAEFNEDTAELRTKTEFLPVIGNHEQNSPLYFENFKLSGSKAWYSVNRKNAHFIVLDSGADLKTGSEQYRWLENELKSAAERPQFVIVLFHYPVFTSIDDHADNMGLKHLIALFEKHGVNIVFNGHSHNYERFSIGGIEYIVSGGGGAPLYDRKRTSEHSVAFSKAYHYCKLAVYGEQMTVTAIDIDSKIIDEVTVHSRTLQSAGK